MKISLKVPFLAQNRRKRCENICQFQSWLVIRIHFSLTLLAVVFTGRNVKQAMGVEDPQNGWWRRKSGSHKPGKKAGANPRGRKGEKAITHTLAMAFAAYAIVVVWYLNNGNRHEDVARVRREAPWYRHKERPSFLDMLAAVRRERWVARLSRYPVLIPVAKKFRELLPHWLLAA